MSGIFKNFERIICASNFNLPNHKYIVRTFFQNFSPAGLYHNPTENLGRTHGKDVFQLSLITYQLVRQNQQISEMLENLSEEEHSNFYNEISVQKEANNIFINDALSEINLQFDIGISETPISGLCSYVYALGQQANVQAGKKDFEKFIQAQLLQKIGYASQQDLIDLVSGLNKLSVTDKKVWEQVLKAIESKTFDWQLENVDYHAWQLDTYENPDGAKASSSYYENQLSHTQAYYQDITSGTGQQVADIKRKLRQLNEQVFFRILNPFFFRETRPCQFQWSLSPEIEKDSLFENLESVTVKVPEAKKTLDNLRARN